MKKGLYLTFYFKKIIFGTVLTFILLISLAFYRVYTESVTTSATATFPVVIIDAGHGGEDGGTQSESGIIEKDINLKIAVELNSILQDKGYRTVMVRKTDKLIYDENCSTIKSKKTSDLHNRMSIMKKYNDCIFISIHQNHFSESKYSGAQVFYRPDHDESAFLAEHIQKSIVNSLQNENTRQIKECSSDVYLIHKAVSTAVMVECGFLSNAQEAEKLNSESYQIKMAEAISTGLENYLSTRM